jgi:hypothetical protein
VKYIHEPPGSNAKIDAYNLVLAIMNSHPHRARLILSRCPSAAHATALLAELAAMNAAVLNQSHPDDSEHFLSHVRIFAEQSQRQRIDADLVPDFRSYRECANLDDKPKVDA